MDQFDNKDELLKDLRLIKEAARKNNNILKFIFVSEGIKNIALFLSLVIIAFSLLFLWLISNYGSIKDVPNMAKAAVYVMVGLTLGWLVWLKVNVFLKLAKKYKKEMNLAMLVKDIYTRTFVIITIQFSISIAVIWIFLSVSGIPHLIIPVLSIIISLLMVSLMTTLNLKDFLFTIEWLLISGSFSLFFAETASAPVLLILTFGIGMLILYLSALSSTSREKRDRVGRK